MKAREKKGGSSDAGFRSRSQVKSGCTYLFLPPPPGPEGLPPQPIGRGLMLMPHFLSSAAWDQLHPVERERAGVAVKWERDLPDPAPPMHHRDLGPNPQGSQPLLHP